MFNFLRKLNRKKDEIPVQIKEVQQEEDKTIQENWWGGTWSPGSFTLTGTTTPIEGKWHPGNFSTRETINEDEGRALVSDNNGSSSWVKPRYGLSGMSGSSGVSGVSGVCGTTGFGISGFSGTMGFGVRGTSGKNKPIDYYEYIAENVDNAIRYSEYIADNLDHSGVILTHLKYLDYLANELDSKSSEIRNYLQKKKEVKRIYSDADPYGEENWEA
jgi:hypothetical protein